MTMTRDETSGDGTGDERDDDLEELQGTPGLEEPEGPDVLERVRETAEMAMWSVVLHV